MTTPVAIAEALSRIREQADSQNTHIVHTEQMSRGDRELLLATGWLQEIIRGWYMIVRPDIATGDIAAWYANLWDFVRVYLGHRFGNEYCLSAESSLELHIDNPTTPIQIIVIVKHAAGLQKMLHDTSLLMYQDLNNFPTETEYKHGIKIMSLAYALCKVTPTYFKNSPRNAEIALRSIEDSSNLSRMLVKYNFKSSAARLVGAYKFLNDTKTANSIKQDLLLAGMLITPVNPFVQPTPLLSTNRITSPYAARIMAMWADVRSTVEQNFPAPPKSTVNIEEYMQSIEHIYQYDAYNSLSIEGYQVSNELINKVKNNLWNPMQHLDDANIRNALAAKGYYDAFQIVKGNIEQILNGTSAAAVVKDHLQTWHQRLFYPAVQAGIIKPEDLIGYRNDRVFIRNSRHSPPPKESVLDSMDTFFSCLANESHPGVRAILGHYFFVFIHPYMDGNGRIGRFVMNALLAAGGYPWTVVTMENRSEYISCLETAHTTGDLSFFTRFISSEMSKKLS